MVEDKEKYVPVVDELRKSIAWLEAHSREKDWVIESYYKQIIRKDERIAQLEAGLRELAEWPASPYAKERAKDILGEGKG